MQSSTFDEVLGLEEKFYEDGFRRGLADGVQAGRIEGRTFGLEKGFEKYVESSRLYARSIAWANRIPQLRKASTQTNQRHLSGGPDNMTEPLKNPNQRTQSLPSLPDNQRLAKHLKILHAVSESGSLPTENTEEAVSDFDDRLKRAKGKAKIIERMIGEARAEVDGVIMAPRGNSANIEDVRKSTSRN